MSEKVVFPGWRFGPDGQSAVFQTADEVPEGWTDNPNDHIKGAAKPEKRDGPPVPSKYDGWDREKMVTTLTERKVAFNKKWPEKKLLELLVKTEPKE